MEVKYDISQYIASVKMSRKNRVLVEGRDDKSHLHNLLTAVLGKSRVKIDTAELIKGDCQKTAKNNRAKIDEIHARCANSDGYGNLYFLCDREFNKFEIERRVIDLMDDHEREGNFCWTRGHSFENYFIEKKVICDAFRYLTSSEFKGEAIGLFNNILPESLNIISAISLAARDLSKMTYPLGVIHWRDFEILGGIMKFPVDRWRSSDETQIKKDFISNYKKYYPVVYDSDDITCARICRGHTAMQLLQRIFSACLYRVGADSESSLAAKHAEEFSRIKESSLSSALCESWLRSIAEGNENYPNKLVSAVA